MQRSRIAAVGAAVLIAGAIANLVSMTRWWIVIVTISAAAAGLVAYKREVYGSVWRISRNVTHPLLTRTATAAILVLATLAVFSIAELRDRLQYSQEYGYRDTSSSLGWGSVSQFVHKNVTDARILAVGDNRVFPLYGDRLNNHIERADNSLESIDAVVRKLSIDVVVSFNPVIQRTSVEAFKFRPSVGRELLETFPDRYRALYVDRDAYVLAANSYRH